MSTASWGIPVRTKAPLAVGRYPRTGTRPRHPTSTVVPTNAFASASVLTMLTMRPELSDHCLMSPQAHAGLPETTQRGAGNPS